MAVDELQAAMIVMPSEEGLYLPKFTSMRKAGGQRRPLLPARARGPNT